ncbi:MAG: hypothetical protein R2772_11755 [Chitinophagales bacterium]
MLPNLHKNLSQLFQAGLIREDGPSVACNIYDKLTEGSSFGSNPQNSLGENLNKLINCINDDFFNNYNPSEDTSIEYYFGTYIYWLYLIVERYEFVFDLINPDSKSKLLRDYKVKNFKAFKEVKNWCIFYKHPREFTLCHWPLYLFEKKGNIELKKDLESEYVVIDYQYVETNFTKNGKRLPNLENNPKVAILLPDLEDLTLRFIGDFNRFIDLICQNEIVSEYLKTKSTLTEYYGVLAIKPNDSASD